MTLDDLFDRPLGAVELQIALGISSLWWAISLMIGDAGLWNTQAMQSFYGWLPSRVVAVPWLIAGILNTMNGIRRVHWYMIDGSGSPRWEPASSFVAGAISCPIWGWIFLKSVLLLYGTLPSLGMYLVMALAGFRVMLSAWRRWR